MKKKANCDWCKKSPVREIFDGDHLCQKCCDKWVRGEQPRRGDNRPLTPNYTDRRENMKDDRYAVEVWYPFSPNKVRWHYFRMKWVAKLYVRICNLTRLGRAKMLGWTF